MEELKTIEQALDIASRKGAFGTEENAVIYNALQVIKNKLEKKDSEPSKTK